MKKIILFISLILINWCFAKAQNFDDINVNNSATIGHRLQIGENANKFNTPLTLIKNGDSNGTDNVVLDIKHSGNGSNIFGSPASDNGIIRVHGFNTNYTNKVFNSHDNFVIYTNGSAVIGENANKFNTPLTLVKNGDSNGTDNAVLDIKHSGNGSNIFGNPASDNGIIRVQGFNTTHRNKVINSHDNFVVYTNGIVTIGDTPISGDAKLYVGGKILSEEVKCALRSSDEWKDTVFESTYQLPALEEVETFIQQNKHLPDVPSAQELVDAGGINLKEMTATMMGKIEELTLYTIEQEKELKKKTEEVEQLKATLSEVLKRLDSLENNHQD